MPEKVGLDNITEVLNQGSHVSQEQRAVSQYGGKGVTGIQCIEAKDIAENPTMYKTAPTAKNLLAPNDSSGKLRMLCRDAPERAAL